MALIKEIFRIDEKQWSGDVETKWSPPAGFFTKSSAEIARGLKSASKDYAQASRRLNFYINRGGKNLSPADKSRLEAAKASLKRMYGIKESAQLSEQRYNMDYNQINPATVSAIDAVAKQHLAHVSDKETVSKLLSSAYARGFSAGRSQYEDQCRQHLATITSKESIKSAMDAAFARGYSAGKSSWQ